MAKNPRQISLAGTIYPEGKKLDISGPLAALVSKGQEYLDSITGGIGPSLSPLGLAIRADRDRVVIDSSWQMSGNLPPLAAGQPPLPADGTLKIRIAALGSPSLRKKGADTAARTAKDYKQIREYAIGLSYDSSQLPLDSDIIITYQNLPKQKYSLSSLSGKTISELVNVSKVTSVAPQGPLAPVLAGAISALPTPPPPFNAATSPFGADFSSGWASTNWVA